MSYDLAFLFFCVAAAICLVGLAVCFWRISRDSELAATREAKEKEALLRRLEEVIYEQTTRAYR
jgi:hypothetical protein